MRRRSLVWLLLIFFVFLSASVGESHGPLPGRLLIVASARLHGALRSGAPCHHEYGGLAMRAAYHDELRAGEPATIAVDAGDFVAGAHVDNPRALAGALMMARTMGMVGYEAWTPGESELGYGLARLIEFDTGLGNTGVSANLRNAAGQPILKRWTVRNLAGVRVGITGVIDPELLRGPELHGQAELTSRVIQQDFFVDEPSAALAAAVRTLRPRVDVIVVLAHAKPFRAAALVENISGIDVVVVGHTSPMEVLEPSEHPTLVAFPSDRSMAHLIRLELDAMNRPGNISLSSTRLGSCHAPAESGDSTIVRAIDEFERHEAALVRRASLESSEASALGSASRYLGGEVCARCHADVAAAWRTGAHARAFEPLVRSGRERDESCLPCHVTAWQEPGGYTHLTGDDFDLAREDDPNARPPLAGVQCEACHGQGALHGTRRMVTQVSEEACRSCHDAVNDPHFDYAKAVAGGFHHR
ncbi:MAG TPA: multiheme c-type cytochrome [Candidatus Eisenbacteria bacterium]